MRTTKSLELELVRLSSDHTALFKAERFAAMNTIAQKRIAVLNSLQRRADDGDMEAKAVLDRQCGTGKS